MQKQIITGIQFHHISLPRNYKLWFSYFPYKQDDAFKRAPVWDWHSESLKHVWIVWSCLNKQEKEKNQVISTHEWMLTSCKMSSSFGITQSSSEASLWEVRESGGRERKRLNVRERERERECFDTSNLWSLTFITTIIVEDLSTVSWIYNGSFRWMS